MKRIFSILFALVLAVSLTLVPAVVSASPGVINVPGDYSTIQAAIDAASPGDTIIVAEGDYFGAIVTKAVEIKGEEGAIITDGPAYRPGSPLHFGFKLYDRVDGTLVTGSGATIRHFTFSGEYLAFPVFAFRANDVTVKNCTMINPNQGITNWEGSGWHIMGNTVEGLQPSGGGGIGIFIGSFDGGPACDNFVGFNRITASVTPDSPYYTTPGIGLMSDARWGASGGPVQDNKVLHNHVAVTGLYDSIPVGVGIELTDVGWESGTTPLYVKDNKVVQNDPSASSIPLAFNPEDLPDYNVIHNNPGKGIGHGLPPARLYRPAP